MTGYLLPFGRHIKLGQPYGSRPGMYPNPAGGHNGDDWLTQIGEPVRAAGDGEVVFAGQFDDTYADNFGWNLNYGGNMVVLNMDGDAGPYFEYGHLSKIVVANGARVKRGQIIAYSGNSDGGTGVSTGPHCHVGALPPNFNLNTNTYGRVNPRLYMTDYWDDEKGSIEYAGEVTTPTQPQEDELSAAEVKQIKDHINDVFLGTYAWDGRLDNPGLGKVIIENQKRITASLDINKRLLALVEALPTNVWWNVTVEREDAEGKKYKVPALQELANIGTHQGKDSTVLLEIAGRPAEQVAVEMDKVFSELASRINPDEEAGGDN